MRHYTMAYVKRRITKSGALSSALVESYRDKDGRPRQRILANLHGAEDALHALARLATQLDRLRKERKALEPDIKHAQRFYEIVTLNTLHGHIYSAVERKEIDSLLKARKKLLKRVAEIDLRLAEIQKDGAVIKRHCPATPEEIRAAAHEYEAELDRAEALMAGCKHFLDEAKATLRTLSS
jgi:chromosome segregation ATPase